MRPLRAVRVLGAPGAVPRSVSVAVVAIVDGTAMDASNGVRWGLNDKVW